MPLFLVVGMSNVPRIRSLEIAITYVCNVKCHNCNSLCTQAPVKQSTDMTVDQVRRFVDESVACSYPWERLLLFGGEPTLHPNFLDICTLLYDYRLQHNRRVSLICCSNGSNPGKVDAAVKMGFEPHVSVKRKTNYPWSYEPVNISPVDRGIKGTPGCHWSYDCGIGMNTLGFWPCSPAGAAARVFGYAAPVTSVKDITAERLMTMYSHCDHCGAGLVSEPRAMEQVSSPEWVAKLDAYNKRI